MQLQEASGEERVQGRVRREDRRRFSRVVLGPRALVLAQGRALTYVLRDLSLGGASLSGPSIERRQPCELVIPRAGQEPLRLKARVRRSSVNVRDPGIAVRFEALDEEAKDAIQSLLLEELERVEAMRRAQLQFGGS